MKVAEAREEVRASTGRGLGRIIRDLWARQQVATMFVVLLVVYSIMEPKFFSAQNIRNLLVQNSSSVIVAMGQFLAILTRGIDLSVGTMMGFAGVVVARAMMEQGLSFWASLGFVLLLGLGYGTMTGVIISRGKIAPFIVTLATMCMAKGLTFMASGGHATYVRNAAFKFFGTGSVLGIPVPIIVAAAVVLVVHFVMNHTAFGRRLYAIGSNPEAARLVGINVSYHLCAVYTISGLLAALGGALLAARLGVGSPQTGTGEELDAIAAVVVGGASFAGGSGTPFNTLLGALIMGFIRNILNLLGVPAYPQLVIKGVIILAAVVGRRE